jgi:hypothetical protein
MNVFTVMACVQCSCNTVLGRTSFIHCVLWSLSTVSGRQGNLDPRDLAGTADVTTDLSAFLHPTVLSSNSWYFLSLLLTSVSSKIEVC